MTIEIRKPTARDTAAIRALLKTLGIKAAVRKMNWAITIGTQCERFSQVTAAAIVHALKGAGYLIDMEDVTASLIAKNLCDVIMIQIQA